MRRWRSSHSLTVIAHDHNARLPHEDHREYTGAGGAAGELGQSTRVPHPSRLLLASVNVCPMLFFAVNRPQRAYYTAVCLNVAWANVLGDARVIVTR